MTKQDSDRLNTEVTQKMLKAATFPRVTMEREKYHPAGLVVEARSKTNIFHVLSEKPA